MKADMGYAVKHDVEPDKDIDMEPNKDLDLEQRIGVKHVFSDFCHDYDNSLNLVCLNGLKFMDFVGF